MFEMYCALKNLLDEAPPINRDYNVSGESLKNNLFMNIKYTLAQ